MSLRWRLTLLTTALIAAAAIVLGLAVFATAQRVQLGMVDRTLSGALSNPRVRALEARLASTGNGGALVGLARVVPGTDQLSVVQQAGTAFETVPFPQLTSGELAAAATGPITIDGSPPQRVLVRDVRPGRLTVAAAMPLADLQEAQRRLAIGIVVSALAVTAIGALASWLLVRRFMRPVDDIAAAATAIAAGDIDRRVPVAQPGTEVGQLAEALNAMIGSLSASLAEVQDSEERLRRFVSDASHEIRTPLTVISGYVELLQRGPGPADPMEARALERISAESQRLERLVTQLLLLERLDRDAAQQARDFDLAPVVAEGFADIAAPLTDRSVALDLEAATIHGDPDAWRQVVANLTQNIERHTPAGSPVVVTLTPTDDGTVLLVDDSGPGIPQDQRDTARERFARVDPSRSSSTGGFGLGIGIVESVVRSSGGRLELLESPTGGLRVRISIPRTPRGDDDGNLRAGP